MQETIVKGILKYFRTQTPEFKYIMDDYFDTEQGFTEELSRRLAKVNYNIKEEAWTACMWNIGKPEIQSHRPKIFKVRDVQFVNKKGDLVPELEALDPTTKTVKPGYRACSPDYRYTIVQSVINLDYIFNSMNKASLFQELFTIRLYMSSSCYINLPILGNTCVYIDEIAMGDIEKFDRTSQGTLLSLPIDIIATYPLIAPVIPADPKPFETERKTLIQNISFVKDIQEPHGRLE